jgi:hypothetical protein
MPKCQVKGCDAEAQWFRSFGGPCVNVCDEHRLVFANPNLSNPEVETNAPKRDAPGKAIRPVDSPVPELHSEPAGDVP